MTLETSFPDHKTVFLGAADSARRLLDVPGLAERWEETSALERMTIGELTAHLSRAVTLVPRYLGAPAPPPYRDAAGYFHAVLPEVDPDLDSDLAAAVRARSREEAEQGLDGIRRAWDEARAELGHRLDPPTLQQGIAVRGSAMQVGEYLTTRLVELVVHADDLAASLAVPSPAFSTGATASVISCLTAVAALRSSPIEVIRALTRQERATPGVLRVF
jgi:hypothetical protein